MKSHVKEKPGDIIVCQVVKRTTNNEDVFSGLIDTSHVYYVARLSEIRDRMLFFFTVIGIKISPAPHRRRIYRAFEGTLILFDDDDKYEVISV